MAARGQRSAHRTREGEVELGPARLGEARALAAISRSYIEHGLEWRWRSDSIAAGIRAEDTRVVVARDVARLPVGFAMMAFDFGARTAHLQLLAVVPSHRRQGLATRLVVWLEAIAKRGGIRRLELEVRAREAPARAFYGRLGFREIARLPGYYQGRESALRLSRGL
jgi:ribosomal-protein-alanine N-acetyltransferase